MSPVILPHSGSSFILYVPSSDKYLLPEPVLIILSKALLLLWVCRADVFAETFVLLDTLSFVLYLLLFPSGTLSEVIFRLRSVTSSPGRTTDLYVPSFIRAFLPLPEFIILSKALLLLCVCLALVLADTSELLDTLAFVKYLLVEPSDISSVSSTTIPF